MIDDDTMAALMAGDTVAIKATLKRPKPRAEKALDPETAEIRREVMALWLYAYPEHDPARVWKALRAVVSTPHLAALVDIAVDYNKGRNYPVEWFVKDLPQWAARWTLEPFAQLDDRDAYRKKAGLGG